jgi:tRNA (guanine6-N2)-methyltransferase
MLWGGTIRMEHYFVRLTSGLEAVTWDDLQQKMPGVTLKQPGYRRIDFLYNGSPTDLLALRSVDDVYVYAGTITGLDHTRQSLSLISQFFATIDLQQPLAVCRRVRSIGKNPSYSITASHMGKRNYTRYDVEAAIAASLTRFRYAHWRFQPNRPDEHDTADLNLRVILEDDRAMIGLQLGDIPLHRRPYKTSSQPGSLKAPVAYCMCLQAALSDGDTVLDPMCGAGTLLIEAATLVTQGTFIGGDIDTTSLQLSAANARQAGLPVQDLPIDATGLPLSLHSQIGQSSLKLYHGDAQTVPFPDDSLQAVITNLPWGQQVSPQADLQLLYKQVLAESARVLGNGHRAVVLTDQHELLQESLKTASALTLLQSYQISLFGRHPTIYVLQKLAH